MLEAALYLAERGWRIFPCHHPVDAGSCSCRDTHCTKIGKHPLIRDWRNVATNDPRMIDDWWRTWPDANIGFPTGTTSGVLALDTDPRHGGDAALADLEGRFGALPETLKSRTGSGGSHHLFRHVLGIDNSAGRVGPGLDVRSDGGYILLPPSLHQCGKRYRWDLITDLAAAPDWLVDRMRDLGPRTGVSGTGTGNSRSASHWRALLEVAEGGRDNAVTSVAGLLLSKGHRGDRYRELLRQYNRECCQPPLPDRDVVRIARSIERRHAR
jgi:putative DNA primase/helicase